MNKLTLSAVALILTAGVAQAEDSFVTENHYMTTPIKGNIVCEAAIRDHIKPFTETLTPEAGAKFKLTFVNEVSLEGSTFSGYTVLITRVDGGLNDVEAKAEYLFDYANRFAPCDVVGFSFGIKEY